MQTATKMQSFTGLRATRTAPVQAKMAVRPARSSVVVRADFIGSTTNQIMVISTFLPLVAGRFGLAPTAKKRATAGCKLYDDKTVLLGSNDPAGLTATDVLALGAFGHAVGVGIVLGLKGTGNL